MINEFEIIIFSYFWIVFAWIFLDFQNIFKNFKGTINFYSPSRKILNDSLCLGLCLSKLWKVLLENVTWTYTFNIVWQNNSSLSQSSLVPQIKQVVVVFSYIDLLLMAMLVFTVSSLIINQYFQLSSYKMLLVMWSMKRRRNFARPTNTTNIPIRPLS